MTTESGEKIPGACSLKPAFPWLFPSQARAFFYTALHAQLATMSVFIPLPDMNVEWGDAAVAPAPLPRARVGALPPAAPASSAGAASWRSRVVGAAQQPDSLDSSRDGLNLMLKVRRAARRGAARRGAARRGAARLRSPNHRRGAKRLR